MMFDDRETPPPNMVPILPRTAAKWASNPLPLASVVERDVECT